MNYALCIKYLALKFFVVYDKRVFKQGGVFND